MKRLSPIILVAVLLIFNIVMYLYGKLGSMVIRVPRTKAVAWDAALDAQPAVLSAIWSRHCSHPQDINFPTRNIMRALVGTDLPHLSYSSSLGEVYKDLTVNMLGLTMSPELILAALRSYVADAPSWTVDWFMREPLRTHPSELEKLYDLFYDPNAPPMPPNTWIYDAIRPDVLQIQARKLGTVNAVLGLRSFEDFSWYAQSAADVSVSSFADPRGHDRRATNIHNLKTLMQLEVARANHNGHSGGSTMFGRRGGRFPQFMEENQTKQPEEIISMLLEHPQRYFSYIPSPNASSTRSPRMLPLMRGTLESIESTPQKAWRVFLFEDFVGTCERMERKVFVATGISAPQQTHNNYSSTWPAHDMVSQLAIDAVYRTRLYPAINTASTHDGGEISSCSENEIHSSSPPSKGVCRVRAGYMVYQIRGLSEKAVLGQVGDKLIFVDALEGLDPVSDSTRRSRQAGDDRGMPWVEIS